ncbi:NAD(P)-dependent oxidoreductase [Candidatus Mcinerneyibacteriota bacterium]|nr:NAD(P)-dependent oxidoreductase [Candidatus Mcinerneyibacteriota bacterium]
MKWDYDYCITGATGFVGSNIVDEILETEPEARILCLVRKSSDITYLHSRGVKTAVVDFSDPLTMEGPVSKSRYLLHLVGLTQARRDEMFRKVNRDLAEIMLSLYLKHRKTVKGYLFMSSLAVAGPRRASHADPCIRSGCRPVSRYGISKLEGESLLWPWLDDPSLHIVIVRPPAVYGPRDKDMKITFEWARRGIAPVIGWKPKKVTLIHARDLARFSLTALKSPPQKDPIFHVHGGEALTQMEIYREAAAAFGRRRLFTVHVPYWAALFVAWLNELCGKNKILNREKVREINEDWGYERNDFERMGLKPRYSLREGVSDTYRINNPCRG